MISGTQVKHCPRCGGRLPTAPPTSCPACSYAIYVNPRPTANLIVLDGPLGPRAKFLALRRAMEPQAGLWETPGGFCDGWEHPRDAALREGREELGVDVRLGGFIGMFMGDYAHQGELLPVLDCFWLAWLPGDRFVLDPAESLDSCWFPLVSAPKLAFATMDCAIAETAARLGFVTHGQ